MAILIGELMHRARGNIVRWLFDSRCGPADRLIPRWIFLRTLALWYFSAFYSLLFQIKGLMGPQGVLPAEDYLAAVARALGPRRFWFAPSLFWVSSSSQMLMAVMIVGLIASVVAFLNLWPRLGFLVCWICFLSFVTATECLVELPVGWDAAGGRLSLAVLCARAA